MNLHKTYDIPRLNLWANNILLILGLSVVCTTITPATLSSLASTLIDRTSGTLNGAVTLKPYPPLRPVTCNALSRTVPFASPQWETLVSGPAKTGLGKRLILCMILLVETVEHILRDQFHGRRELAGQDRYLLVESADLLRELVDNGVRIGWNLSQNKSPFNAEPPQSDWIAGVEKTGKYGLVGGGHRVDTGHCLKLFERQSASEIRLNIRDRDIGPSPVERRKHATLIVAP